MIEVHNQKEFIEAVKKAKKGEIIFFYEGEHKERNSNCH